MKKILLFLLIIASLAVIGYTAFSSMQEKVEPLSLLAHVPDDAVLLIEVDDAQELSERYLHGSPLWKDLSSLPWFQGIPMWMDEIDAIALLSTRGAVDSSFTYLASLHPAGQEDHDWLLSLPASEFGVKDIDRFLHALGYKNRTTRKYDGHEIYTSENENDEIYWTLEDRVVQLSTSILLIEKCSRIQDGALSTRADFLKSYVTKGNDHPAHIHLDHERLNALCSNSRSGGFDLPIETSLGGWSTSDLDLQFDLFRLNGLISTHDSADHFLERFRDQGVLGMSELWEILSQNTSMFTFYGIEDHTSWSSSDAIIPPGLGSGITSAYLSQGSAQPKDLHLIIYGLKDKELMEEFLNSQSEDHSTYRNHEIYTIPDVGIFSTWHGLKLEVNESYQGFILNEHLVMASTHNCAQEVIDHALTKRTLSYDESFQAFENQVSSKSALAFFVDLGNIEDQLPELLTQPDFLSENDSVLSRLQAFMIQYEPATKDRFHESLVLRHDPIVKQEAEINWTLELDTTFTGSPLKVKNHFTRQFDYFIQDDAHNLHLISPDGKVNWTFQLTEPILSIPQEVDIFQNGKLQMAFNTSTQIIVLDRLGRMVDGFPIDLPDSATTALSVLDYDKNRRYRFLIGIKGGKVLNYNVTGKAVKGWEFRAQELDMIGSLHHFKIKDRDHIAMIDEHGSLTLTARDGKVRSHLETTLNGYLGGEVFILEGKDLATTRLYFENAEGDWMKIGIGGRSELCAQHADAVSINRQRSAVLEEGVIQIQELEGEAIFVIDNMDIDVLQLFDNDFLLAWSSDQEVVHLFDDRGILITGFPITATGPSQLFDMDSDGRLDLLLQKKRRILVSYSLPR